MADRSRQPYRRRRRRRSVLYGPLSFLIICIALVFGISVFFKITAIEVEGNGFYTYDEVVEASGLKEGDNLFTSSRNKAVNNIFAKLPYVEEASISKTFPNKITITVSESMGIGYVSDGSGCWLINGSCKILSSIKTSETDGLISITGITAENPEEGKQMEVSDAEALKLEYLKAALNAMAERNMFGDISEIDISSVADLNFRYMDKFDVRLGKNDSIEYKLDLLQSALDKVGENELGTFDLTKDKEVHFIPES